MKKLTIAEIEEKLFSSSKNQESAFLQEIESDDRKGVQQLLKRWRAQKEQEKLAKEKFLEMTLYEKKLWKEGFQYIAGVDEVGRGPLAGPVIAAAVILPNTFYLEGIDDSKKLTEAKREQYYEYIQEHALAIGIGIIEAKEIDEINIYEATKKAMLQAIAQLSIQPDYLLIDAMKLVIPYPQESIIKGDSKSVSIAAASIIAKVTRDQLMKNIGEQYPQYGFSNNMGYGTKEHLLAIEKFGITPFHRKSFSPIKDQLVTE